MDSWYSIAIQLGGLLLIALVAGQLSLALVGAMRRSAFARARHELVLERLRGEVAGVQDRRRQEAERTKSWNGFRKFTVAHKVMEGESICSLYLKPHDDKPLAEFAPGQFVTLRVRIPGQPKATTRCYSLSSSPRAEHYRVSVKRAGPPPDEAGAPPGLMSSYLHRHVAEQGIVDLKAPSGNFHLDLAGRRPIVLVAGGIGVTPMLAMIDALADQGFPREVWLFYGVRNGAEQVFKRHLERIAVAEPKFHLQVCYSEPRPEDRAGQDFQHGERVSVDLFQRVLPSTNYAFYVCGPSAMMEAVVAGLRGWGVPEEDVRFEAFGPASVKRPAAAQDGEARQVRFHRSGRTVTWTPGSGSLLDCAESSGLSIDAGCRAGNCGTCLTALRSGSVGYLHEPGERPEPGSCLICVGVPRSDLVLDA